MLDYLFELGVSAVVLTALVVAAIVIFAGSLVPTGPSRKKLRFRRLHHRQSSSPVLQRRDKLALVLRLQLVGEKEARIISVSVEPMLYKWATANFPRFEASVIDRVIKTLRSRGEEYTIGDVLSVELLNRREVLA